MLFIQVTFPILKNFIILICIDISPNNIFVSHINGSQPVVKLGDLGNSKCLSRPCIHS